MRWIAVPLAALALAGCSGGKDDQPPEASPQTQSPPSAQTSPQAQTPPPARPAPVQLTGPLAPRYVHGCCGPGPRIIEANVSDHTLRYVLQSDTPARFLKRGSMSSFLVDFGFGVKGRPMVVRLLDDEGRFAWAAGYDGVRNRWVFARSDLARCAPILYAPIVYGPNRSVRRLPRARGASDAPPCPLERLPDSKDVANAATVLR
jgi:hypothetical protein